MNLDLDLSVVTRLLNRALSELRQKRVWPVAAVLLAAIVAVPLVLSKSASPAPQPSTPARAPAPETGSALPALNVQSTPAHSLLIGRARDPFAGAAGAAVSSSTTATATAAVTSVASAAHSAVSSLTGSNSTGTSSSSSSTSSSSTSNSSGSSTSSGGGTSNSSSSSGKAKSNSKPSGLTSTQSYAVDLSLTNSSGGVAAVDSLERLSILPSQRRPLLVELGVAKGGKRVLFAVQPGTAVKGPGTCTPGPIDCEILSLAPNQVESVGRQSTSGVSKVGLFAVTAIDVVNHSSAAAAQQARKAASAAGRNLLRNSTLSALSLFQYQSSVGAVVDLRNLSIG